MSLEVSRYNDDVEHQLGSGFRAKRNAAGRKGLVRASNWSTCSQTTNLSPASMQFLLCRSSLDIQQTSIVIIADSVDETAPLTATSTSLTSRVRLQPDRPPHPRLDLDTTTAGLTTTRDIHILLEFCTQHRVLPTTDSSEVIARPLSNQYTKRKVSRFRLVLNCRVTQLSPLCIHR